MASQYRRGSTTPSASSSRCTSFTCAISSAVGARTRYGGSGSSRSVNASEKPRAARAAARAARSSGGTAQAGRGDSGRGGGSDEGVSGRGAVWLVAPGVELGG